MGFYPENCVVLTSEWPLGKDGPLTDADAVTLQLKNENGTSFTVTEIVGPNGQITKPSTGSYRYVLDLTVQPTTATSGWWKGEWVATSADVAVNPKGAKPVRFHVEDRESFA